MNQTLTSAARNGHSSSQKNEAPAPTMAAASLDVQRPVARKTPPSSTFRGHEGEKRTHGGGGQAGRQEEDHQRSILLAISSDY